MPDRRITKAGRRAAVGWPRFNPFKGVCAWCGNLLLSGVPEDDRPIMHYRRPEEVDALWDQAYA